MTIAPEFSTRTGVVRLAETTFAALSAQVRGEGDPAEGELERLRSAGVLHADGRPHDALAPALAAVANPALATLTLSYKGRALRGWVGTEHAALLRPADEGGRHVLMPVGLSLVPEALARLVDLSPRPRPEPARPISYQEGMLGPVNRHWRLSVQRTDGQEIKEESVVEVVDAEAGLWILRSGEDGGVVAWPTTPTRVWRLIARLSLAQSV